MANGHADTAVLAVADKNVKNGDLVRSWCLEKVRVGGLSVGSTNWGQKQCCCRWLILAYTGATGKQECWVFMFWKTK